MKKHILLSASLFAVSLAFAAEPVKYDAFHPGELWLDTDGNPIQCHGGSIIVVDGVYYWYGENKCDTDGIANVWHHGVNLYSSTDLYNWKYEGNIIPPDPDHPDSPLYPSTCMDRPHILWNASTRKFVCWLKIMGQDGRQSETVLTADAIRGPWTEVRRGLYPLGMSGGDFDLVVAGDGKAYYYFERVHSELICADLTDDYTDVTGYYSTHMPRICPPYVREAPAHFLRGGRHYLITSGTSGYYPNPSEIAVAETWHGPWTTLGNPHPLDASRTSYHSQVSSVFKVPGKKDLYIALGDRWLPNRMNIDYAETEAQYRRWFGLEADTALADRWVEKGGMAREDTKNARYVWLPFTFGNDGIPVLLWRDSWRTEEFD